MTTTTTIIDQRTLVPKESLQQVDFLTRQLIRKYPEHPEVEIETAVLLAVLETGDIQDRERIRTLAGKLLSDGGIDAARAIAGTCGVAAIARNTGLPAATHFSNRAAMQAGCGILS